MKHFEELGQKAFNQGKGNFPLADKEIYEIVKDMKVGTGAKKIMKAFNKGWTKANIAAPVK